MSFTVPVRSLVSLQLTWDEQGERIVQVFTRGNTLVTTIYMQNLLNHTGDMLLDSSSQLVLDSDMVAAIKHWVEEKEAELEKKRATKAAASKARKAREPREEV